MAGSAGGDRDWEDVHASWVATFPPRATSTPIAFWDAAGLSTRPCYSRAASTTSIVPSAASAWSCARR